DRLFASPAFCMDSRIDDQSDRAEKFVTKTSQISEWIVVVPPDLFRQPFAVKRPAFDVSREWQYFAKLWNAFELLGRGELPMMSRHTLMICECRHAPFWHFIHVAQVREKDAGTAAIHGGNIVIRARSSYFFKLRNAANFDLRVRSCEKQFLRRALCRLRDQLRIPRQCFGTSFVII